MTFEVPADVRVFLRAWAAYHGNPTTDPVFPVRRGERAGKAKKASNMSYADRLRRELTKAGVTRHELHVETATTLPVDFHSTRRAYSQALARAGTNEQTAMLLTGHADSKTHRRYIESVTSRVLPFAAVPAICMADAETIRRKSPKCGAGHEIRTRDPELGNWGFGGAGRELAPNDGPLPDREASFGVPIGGHCPIALSEPASVHRLPLTERAELRRLARELREALPEGPSRARELAVALEQHLELSTLTAAVERTAG